MTHAPVLLTDLIGVAQREVGARWHRAEVMSAEEHVVTGVLQAALEALSSNARRHDSTGIVVACAEGDWHSLPAQMLAEALRAGGDLQPRVVRAGRRTCALARAVLLGADAWAVDAASAALVLRTWRQDPPQVEAEPVEIDLAAVELDARAEEFGSLAYDALAERFPPMATYDQRQPARTHEDLVYIVRFLAAARLVDDDEVFTEFTAWLEELLVACGVPAVALAAGLEVLAPLVRAVDEHSSELASAGAVGVA